MGLLCGSLGAGNGRATWNYKLLNTAGGSAAAEIVLTRGWLQVNVLRGAPLAGSGAPALRLEMCQGAGAAGPGSGACGGVCSSELLIEMTNGYRYSFCSVPENTGKSRRGPRQFLHLA